MLNYEDSFIIDSVDSDVVQAIEDEVRLEVDIMLSGISGIDPALKETLIKYKVYMRLAVIQFEADGMQEKYNAYANNFKSLLQTIKSGTTDPNLTLTTIPLERG